MMSPAMTTSYPVPTAAGNGCSRSATMNWSVRSRTPGTSITSTPTTVWPWLPQPLGQQARRAPQVQDPDRGSVVIISRISEWRGAVALLEGVLLGSRHPLEVPKPCMARRYSTTSRTTSLAYLMPLT